MSQQEMDEYKKLAEKALNEPDPKKALELYHKALELGKKLGLGGGELK